MFRDSQSRVGVQTVRTAGRVTYEDGDTRGRPGEKLAERENLIADGLPGREGRVIFSGIPLGRIAGGNYGVFDANQTNGLQNFVGFMWSPILADSAVPSIADVEPDKPFGEGTATTTLLWQGEIILDRLPGFGMTVLKENAPGHLPTSVTAPSDVADVNRVRNFRFLTTNDLREQGDTSLGFSV